jgi:hypothetical protein
VSRVKKMRQVGAFGVWRGWVSGARRSRQAGFEALPDGRLGLSGRLDWLVGAPLTGSAMFGPGPEGHEHGPIWIAGGRLIGGGFV